jgi:hypothetical protein
VVVKFRFAYFLRNFSFLQQIPDGINNSKTQDKWENLQFYDFSVNMCNKLEIASAFHQKCAQ